MDSSIYVYVIIIAFAVTYPFRSVPALFVSKLNLSPYFQRLLDIIPYTAITALVFPGIFFCIQYQQYTCYFGTLVAIFASLLKLSLSLIVLLTVLAVYIVIAFL